MSNCSHEAWDFGALQCPDCGAVKGHVADADYAKLEAEVKALRGEVVRLLEDRARFPDRPDDIGRMIGAHIENLKHVAEASRRMCLKAMRERDVVEQDLETLRARVVVVPERKLLNAGVPGLNRNSGWNACLDELARINGMTVSEGLVQGMAKFAREIICGALDGGSFDGADIQESAERHGLIAKQVMNEPCRGPEEYCACAWSTSFPAECYRVTPELRALLNEDKENGNG
ncbi:apolipoprotein A1/A4/E family protein [Pseudomonas aeruginosa]|uniref:hypothetical protein n=1 Tax=Pseudomonas aeruginosa TaxID=287 RepID=UPI002447A4C9|nr:hypothetical protein [Pseudomonas aeruginosa]MDG9805493.1 apolipoprotein A1/A4/E family protein [Pseudomonas aeruginosa]MDG9907073.1 apolipoprotein A1/A4/E family protein [Pseudomonas aeruginosa]MDH0003479.1 apolipoprotein A1/A4/E family protein [Pseudomonas aeruginosa]MDH0011625.1 apolipoprotein A1/A4/E family protein [Pseudomonas aeruginosa]MDH0598738.1 apolipoprotein A1/A4/E family protein [Pseudomonas aeruginosa]